MQTVAIVGVGLIGASFGLALRQSGFSGPILGVSSPSAIDAGLSAGAISAPASLEQAAAQADLIYLAQPVDRIIATLIQLGPLARPHSLITDAGSTKAVIVQTAAAHLQHASFIGGHPMAGKESRGAQSSDPNLFRNRPYVLTPHPNSSVPDHFRQTLHDIGANVLVMTPEHHDATVALTSHLPQLISTALAANLANHNNPEVQQVFGSGLLDMTRLALSPADLWTSILATNLDNVTAALQSFAETLSEFKESLQTSDLQPSFNLAAEFAARLRKPSH